MSLCVKIVTFSTPTSKETLFALVRLYQI